MHNFIFFVVTFPTELSSNAQMESEVHENRDGKHKSKEEERSKRVKDEVAVVVGEKSKFEG